MLRGSLRLQQEQARRNSRRPNATGLTILIQSNPAELRMRAGIPGRINLTALRYLSAYGVPPPGFA